MMKRRQFLTTALAVSGAALATNALFAQEQKRLHIAINQYTCNRVYMRDQIDFWTRLDELKSIGVDGIEPTLKTVKDAEESAKRLADHGLAMRSIYSGANMHDEKVAADEIDRLLKLGEKAKEFGTEILVCNPAAKQGKSDAELVFQSKNLNIVGAGLKKLGITFAFHYHQVELEFAAREFHQVLCGTDPKNLSLCFEQHYSYRGCGNSQVALFDHLKLYGDRCVEVHLRQSINNIFSETYGDGDIDNVRFAAELKKLPKMPHIVLEQGYEAETPKTLSPVEAFRQDVVYIRRMFG